VRASLLLVVVIAVAAAALAWWLGELGQRPPSGGA
jgi:hypothetical protein